MRQYTRTVYVKYISLQRNFLLAKYVGMQLLYYRIAAQCENIYSGCFEDRYDAVICVAGKFENIKLYVHTLCISANVTKVSKHSSITQYNLSPFSLVLLIRCQYSFKLVLPSLFLHPTSSFFKLIFCIAHTFF